MIKQFFWGVSLCLISLSCDHDSQEGSAHSSNVQMTGYKINYLSTFPDTNGAGTYQKITIGNILDNKFFSEDSEVIYNGVSQGVQTHQNYFYSNNLLSTRKADDDKKDFFYDGNQNLIGLNWAKLGQNDGTYHLLANYRFSHHPNNIVFVERISLPYNDPAAEIQRRCIVQFDSNDNIIKAGTDADLNGVMDNENLFFYTNDNLTSIQKSNGEVLTFEYSNVINNFMVLNYNSYGKKVYRLMCSEWHSMLYNNDFENSKNLKNQEASDATYEVLSNGYYKKKTKTMVFPENQAQNTTTTEFFFQE
ncbi:hypothetical protein [Flavobacterium humi]|uniref:DUF4595 domain-containing protein n=1 Tax=Flavobacterium humi TaxID=2562683 RepID=A0A4Z0L6X9_9FLAO|nr:hypothetical protein [Flavobacterium humi]TGD56873.1 hypothetical protein E4635_13840 [Flavobacterium humi]